MRICSLLPSATEIVFALGLGESLVGVTHECDFPPAARSLPAVTSSSIEHTGSSSREIHRHITEAVHQGTSLYHLDTELLSALSPDLILTQELCDVCAVSYSLVREAVKILHGDQTIVSLEPTSIQGIFETIQEVGRVTGCDSNAARLCADLSQRVERVTRAALALPRRRVFALEWLDPPFVGGHWVPEMVQRAGGSDGLGIAAKPSFQIDWQRVADYDPEVVVVMPCGYDLEHAEQELASMSLPSEWGKLSARRSGQVYVVDGSSFFNRPGPRIVDGLEILAEILHPDKFPRAHGAECWRRAELPKEEP